MKITKRIISLFLAAVLLGACVSLSSCGNKGTLYATYEKGKVYSEDTDFSDFLWTNIYSYAVQNNGAQLTDTEYNALIDNAIVSTVMYRQLKKHIKELDLSVDMDAVKLAAVSDAEAFEKNYTGGYEKFLKEWNVSENALQMIREYRAMIALIEDEVVEYEKATEQEITDHYNLNASKYYIPPSYKLGNIVLQVIDKDDAAEKAEVLADAKGYIARLQGGESWDAVKQSALIKYNSENGHFYSDTLTGTEAVAVSDFESVSDLDTKLAELEADFKEKNGKTFAEMFPDGFKAYISANSIKENSEEYKSAEEIYYNYSAAVYKAEYNYAITTAFKNGTTYSEPLYHAGFGCYCVLTFVEKTDSISYTPLDEVKDDIREELEGPRKSEAAQAYLERLYDYYNVVDADGNKI